MNQPTISRIIQQHAVLFCIILSCAFILKATLVYPGGTLFDKNSIGFDWSKNFISNLFASKAINGVESTSVIWAIVGVAFHSLGCGLFFIRTSTKIANRNASRVLKIIGLATILLDVLIVTNLHDVIVTFSSTLFLLGLFYITVFILKTKLHKLKVGCILCLAIFYFTLYLYGAGSFALLAIMQKVTLIVSIFLVLSIEYGSSASDFKDIT